VPQVLWGHRALGVFKEKVVHQEKLESKVYKEIQVLLVHRVYLALLQILVRPVLLVLQEPQGQPALLGVQAPPAIQV
jgi:uncharacterized membrane protein YvlD (DUF360 family)